MKTLSKVELNEKAVLLWIAENETLTPKQCLVSYMKSALGLINGRYYSLCSDNAKKKINICGRTSFLFAVDENLFVGLGVHCNKYFCCSQSDNSGWPLRLLYQKPGLRRHLFSVIFKLA